MAQLTSCPECKKQLQVPDELVGKTVQCPECRHMFTVAPPVAEKPASAWDEKPVEPAPPKEKPRHDEDDRDDHRASRRNLGSERPAKVTALGVMALVGGIFAILWFLGVGGFSGGFCCLWPGTYYSLVAGIFGIVKGAALLGADAYRQHPPNGVAIMLLINIISGDPVNLVLGIVMLVFCGDEEVRTYLAK